MVRVSAHVGDDVAPPTPPLTMAAVIFHPTTNSAIYTDNHTNVTWSRDHDDVTETSAPNVPIIVLRSVVMVAIMAVAAFGNALVVISVFKFRRLRGITNYFIVSLALADFLVATCVMPFSASVEIVGRWMFGRVMCDIFNANDVLFSTSSLLHLCCISMDRYIAIVNPLHYEQRMTKRRVALMLCITWGAAALISFVPIHTQIYTTEENLEHLKSDHSSCTFVVNRYYAICSSAVSFWAPCAIMVFIYLKIFKEARRQEEQIRAMQKLMIPLRPPSVRHQPTTCAPSSGSVSISRDRSNSTSSNNVTSCTTVVLDDENGGNEKPLVLNSRQDRKKMKKEHKAAKTLGIIMGAFIICWFPFFIWYITSALCGNACAAPDMLVSVLFWIGYFNSCLNPMIYAFFNREFRNAFRSLLGCGKRKRRSYTYEFNGYNSRDG